jgi:phospholipase C
VFPYIGTGKVLADLGVTGSCGLPAVSWVIPDGNWSDHAGLMSNGNAFGPAWVADIVDAVAGYDNNGNKLTKQCSYWQNTAILITWDDWGGWYDHVEPFNILINTKQKSCDVWGCGYVYGFRVPFIFVSAYTPQGFVSGAVNPQNTTTCTDTTHCYDFGSILQFIESNFNLGPIVGNGQYADVFAKALDAGFFNLTTARTFQPILTPVPPGCFISPTAPNCIPNYTGPVDPDDDRIEPSN